MARLRLTHRRTCKRTRSISRDSRSRSVSTARKRSLSNSTARKARSRSNYSTRSRRRRTVPSSSAFSTSSSYSAESRGTRTSSRASRSSASRSYASTSRGRSRSYSTGRTWLTASRRSKSGSSSRSSAMSSSTSGCSSSSSGGSSLYSVSSSRGSSPASSDSSISRKRRKQALSVKRKKRTSAKSRRPLRKKQKRPAARSKNILERRSLRISTQSRLRTPCRVHMSHINGNSGHTRDGNTVDPKNQGSRRSLRPRKARAISYTEASTRSDNIRYSIMPKRKQRKRKPASVRQSKKTESVPKGSKTLEEKLITQWAQSKIMPENESGSRTYSSCRVSVPVMKTSGNLIAEDKTNNSRSEQSTVTNGNRLPSKQRSDTGNINTARQTTSKSSLTYLQKRITRSQPLVPKQQRSASTQKFPSSRNTVKNASESADAEEQSKTSSQSKYHKTSKQCSAGNRHMSCSGSSIRNIIQGSVDDTKRSLDNRTEACFTCGGVLSPTNMLPVASSSQSTSERKVRNSATYCD